MNSLTCWALQVEGKGKGYYFDTTGGETSCRWPLTDLTSFEGVLMNGFIMKGERMLKSFKQAYKCCFHFYRHSRETETVCPSKRILLTHPSSGGMFESYHVAGDHTFPCGLSCMDALGVSC